MRAKDFTPGLMEGSLAMEDFVSLPARSASPPTLRREYRVAANHDTYPKRYLYKRIVQAKLFIDTNYADSIDLNNIASEAHLSKFHFIRLFKKTYGKTPYQYLTTVRIERAMQFLRMDIPVTEVCFSVGFDSLSSFSGLFKRVVGSAPSVYLRQYKGIRRQISKTPLKFVPGCFAERNGWKKNSNFGEVG